MAPKIIAVPDNIEHTPGEAPSSGLLSSKMILLYRLGIILGIISFIIGSAGLLVLLDEENRSQWYTHTQFADVWRWLTGKNPMVTPMTFNGGAVMAFLCFNKLREDKKAKQEIKQKKKK